MSAAFFYKRSQNLAQADDGSASSRGTGADGEGEKSFFQKNVVDFKEIAQQNFKIPQLLMEREKQKQEEYSGREEVDAAELGVETDELAYMKELDFMYGGSTTAEELAEMEAEEEQKALDPYLERTKRYIRP